MLKKYLIKIDEENPLDLEKVFTSGQVFGWKKVDNTWIGILNNVIVILKQKNKVLEVKASQKIDRESVERYFTLDLELKKIRRTFPKDKLLNFVFQKQKGLRLVRQDAWECLASYICSSFSNIKRIEMNLQALRKRFGKQVKLNDIRLFTFPSAKEIANAKIKELKEIGLGYRASYLKDTAKGVCKGVIDLSKIKELSYEEAWKEFVYSKYVRGVGGKVADCILLYSMDKFEAFPIDVWISKVLVKNYGKLIGKIYARKLERKSISSKTYFEISRKIRNYFGPFSGLCQLYLYSFSRTSSVY